MDTQESFGGRVRRLRGFAVPELPARETDALAGLHYGHVWQIEQGHRENPTLTTAAKIAGVFGCAVGYLLAGEGDPPTADEVRAAVDRARAAQPTTAAA